MRTADPHLNVFHAYRGAAADAESHSRQLEDNLTRALVVLLHGLRDGDARTALLVALGVAPERAGGFERCELQVGSEGVGWPARHRRSLTVVHGGPILRRVPGAGGRTGRADAVVIGREFVLAIESKVGDTVTDGQLVAHLHTLDLRPEPVGDVTWTRLARTARDLAQAARPDSTDAFLLSQFEEYLRMNGFGGFQTDHFSYFTLPADERDRIPEVKEGVRQALRQVTSEIQAAWRPTWTTTVGNIQRHDEHAWAALKPTSAAGGQVPHLSIRLDAAGLSIFANVETAVGHGAFARAWQCDRPGLMQLLRALPSGDGETPPWRFAVRYKFFSGRPRLHDTAPGFDLSVRTLAVVDVDALGTLIDGATRKERGLAYPQVVVERRYPAHRILVDANIGARLASDAGDLNPYFAWLEGAPRARSSREVDVVGR